MVAIQDWAIATEKLSTVHIAWRRGPVQKVQLRRWIDRACHCRCPELAGSTYVDRHNDVAKIVHHAIVVADLWPEIGEFWDDFKSGFTYLYVTPTYIEDGSRSLHPRVADGSPRIWNLPQTYIGPGIRSPYRSWNHHKLIPILESITNPFRFWNRPQTHTQWQA